DPYVAHRVAFHCDEAVVDAVRLEDGLDRLRHAVEQGRGRRKLQEDRQERSLVDEQRDVWTPEQRSGEPVAERGGRRIALPYRWAIHAAAQVLRRSDDEPRSSPASRSRAR